MPFAAAAFEWVNAALRAALIGTIEPSLGVPTGIRAFKFQLVDHQIRGTLAANVR